MQRFSRRLRIISALTALATAVGGLAWLASLAPPGWLLAGLAVVAVVALVLARSLRSWVPRRTVVSIDLEEGLVEQRPDSPLAVLGRTKPTLWEVVSTLERVGTDDRVHAVVIRLGTSGMGLAQAKEIRDAVVRARQAGRRVVAVAETFGEAGNGTADYHLASACDEIVLQRGSEFGVVGFVSRSPFLRGAFDRSAIRPRFDHRREFKSAMYVLTEEDMPQPQREATGAVLASAFEAVVADVAEGRGLDAAAVRAAVDEGPLLPEEARERGLVDRLAFADEVWSHFEDDEKATRVPLSTYLSRRVQSRRGPTVALIHATGPVTRGQPRPDPLSGATSMGSDVVVEAITAAADDDKVEAIVLRVDSPGGSAVASESIWRAVVRARERGTPVVASMGNVAGSGGYYIACGANRIVAQPGTITGSIGVVAGKFVTREAWARLGVRFGEVAAGEHAGIWSSQRDFADDEWERFQRYLDGVYTLFKRRVAEGRDMTADDVEAVAKGRIWSGVDAKEVGLVDELGGIDRALELAKELAGIDADSRLRVRQLPQRSKLPWRRVARGTAASLDGWRGVGDDLRRGAGPVAPLLRQAVGPGVLFWDGVIG